MCQISALRSSDPYSGGWEDDQCLQLARLGAEQRFSVTYREASGPHGEDEPGHTRPSSAVMCDPDSRAVCGPADWAGWGWAGGPHYVPGGG